MLKLEIEYMNFNDEKVSEPFYFNLTEAELLEMEVSGEGGSFADYMKSIVDAKDNATLIAEFKKLVLAAYGKKTPDGKRFVKSDEDREEFSQTAAYNELFMKMAMDEEYAIRFVRGILPKKLVPNLDEVLPVPAKTPPSPTGTNS